MSVVSQYRDWFIILFANYRWACQLVICIAVHVNIHASGEQQGPKSNHGNSRKTPYTQPEAVDEALQNGSQSKHHWQSPCTKNQHEQESRCRICHGKAIGEREVSKAAGKQAIQESEYSH